MSEDRIWCRPIPRDESVVSSEWRSATALAMSSGAVSCRWNLLRSLLHLYTETQTNIMDRNDQRKKHTSSAEVDFIIHFMILIIHLNSYLILENSSSSIRYEQFPL